MTIGCVILAGGKSSRMGTDKALLAMEDKNFIMKLCDTFSFFEEKMIARGYRNEMQGVTWPVIPDIYPEHGPIGGLHGALSSCCSDALFCIPCDMPLIRPEVFEKLLKPMDKDVDAVIAVTEDGKYHPLCGIYKKQAAKVMEEQILNNSNRMMQVIKKIRVEYVKLNSEEDGLYNINTPKEYALYIKTK